MQKISGTSLSDLINYDATLPLEVKENRSEKRERVAIHDISFVGIPGKAPIDAYLVVPDGTGIFAGILWAHWLGEEMPCSRDQYLEEAVTLAPKGVVSLLVNTMWTDEHWYSNRNPDEDYQNSIKQVIELRRALDLLLAQPNIDKSRIGYIGHDFGGMYGMLMAGSTPESVKAYNFIAVAPSLYTWAFYAKQPTSKSDYICQNAPLELTEAIRGIKGANFLFQFSKTDPFISHMDSQVIFRAAPESRQVKYYDGVGHEMNTPEVRTDRAAWLMKMLGL